MTFLSFIKGVLALKRSWMRFMNKNRLLSVLMRKKNKRNTLLFSLLGLGLAGGATAFGMMRGKNNNSIQQIIQKASNSIQNFTPNKLNTSQS